MFSRVGASANIQQRLCIDVSSTNTYRDIPSPDSPRPMPVPAAAVVSVSIYMRLDLVRSGRFLTMVPQATAKQLLVRDWVKTLPCVWHHLRGTFASGV